MTEIQAAMAEVKRYKVYLCSIDEVLEPDRKPDDVVLASYYDTLQELVREWVKVTREWHFMDDGVPVCFDATEPCKICALLAKLEVEP